MNGRVTLTLYFGTKYDVINLPYSQNSIRTEATKTLVLDGQVVWQTTFLNSIRVNVADYQEIVGAQFAEIVDTSNPPLYSHWYEVVGYHQLSPKTALIGLLYDPLLSIGFDHITKITGIINRWTVDNDKPFKYIFSTEPINQIDQFNYSYAKFNPVSLESGGTPIAGFPYNMTVAPKVEEYINSDGTKTNIYTPVLNGEFDPTFFSTDIPNNYTFYDGFRYYLWTASQNSVVYQTFNAAISLGYDLQSNSYILPPSTIFSMQQADNGGYTLIKASKIDYNAPFPLAETSYRNNKANEIGIIFTLYNECTGDSVTVNNYDLLSTAISVFANPYSDGSFYARFSSYLKDSNGVSGIVKSCGWQPLSLTSSTGLGTALNSINNAIKQDVISVTDRAQTLGIETSLQNTFITGRTNYENTILGAARDAYQTGIKGITSANSTNDAISAGIGALGGAVFTGKIAVRSGEALERVAINTYNTAIINLGETIAQQKRALSVEGNIGQTVPPLCKFANANIFSSNAFSFTVRRSSYSDNDRKRADDFFTAFGYNVNKIILNSPEQLRCREKFVFIQADDVQIWEVNNGIDLTRLRDYNTLKYIQDRFSGGIRIWKTTPNYDWSTITNPIVGGTING